MSATGRLMRALDPHPAIQQLAERWLVWGCYIHRPVYVREDDLYMCRRCCTYLGHD